MRAASIMMATLSAFAGVAAFSACTSQETGSTTPSATNEGGAVDRPAPTVTAATDGGVCCPLEYPCSPGYRGGWAETAEECVEDPTYDGRFDRLVDEHGCAYWRSGGAGKDMCCGCPIPRPDASADADADAAADASDG